MDQKTPRQPLRQRFKEAAKATPFYPLYLDILKRRREALKRREIADMVRRGAFSQPLPGAEESRRLVSEWDRAGRPVPPPPAFKQGVVREYGERFGLQTLVETGTFMGDTVAAGRDQFRRIYSVELSADLARLAKERFRGDPHVTILQGDSAAVLPKILSEIHESCLFWLDGHYSGGITALGDSVTPILGELGTIFAHPVRDHVILIDDARDFRPEKNHPTLEELRAFIAGSRPDLLFEVEDDIIRLHRPPSAGA
jgi:hypothetical protein